MARFGVPGIDVRIGDFLQADLEGLAAPDAVFVGGHGGKLIDIIGRVAPLLPDGGRVVLNAVSENSIALFREAASLYDLQICAKQKVAVDEYNPIMIITAVKN